MKISITSNKWKTLPQKIFDQIALYAFDFEDLCIIAPHLAKWKYNSSKHAIDWTMQINIAVFKWIYRNTYSGMHICSFVYTLRYKKDANNICRKYIIKDKIAPIYPYERYENWRPFVDGNNELERYINKYFPNLLSDREIENLKVTPDDYEYNQGYKCLWYDGHIMIINPISEKEYFANMLTEILVYNKIDIIKYLHKKNVFIINAAIVEFVAKLFRARGWYLDMLIYLMKNSNVSISDKDLEYYIRNIIAAN